SAAAVSEFPPREIGPAHGSGSSVAERHGRKIVGPAANGTSQNRLPHLVGRAERLPSLWANETVMRFAALACKGNGYPCHSRDTNSVKREASRSLRPRRSAIGCTETINVRNTT